MGMSFKDWYLANPNLRNPRGYNPLQGQPQALAATVPPAALPLPNPPQRYQVPGTKNNTTSVIDPATGYAIDLTGLKEGQMAGEATVAHATSQDVLFEKRRQQALDNPLMAQLEQLLLNTAQTGGLDEEQMRLMFARGANDAATTARETAAVAGSSLGARGILPNSGLTADMAQRIDMARSAQTRSTERDVRIEALRQSAQNKAQAFAQLIGLGNSRNALTTSQPEYTGNALQGLTELIIQKKALDDAKKQGKKSSDNSLIGSIIGGAASIGGALLGGI